MDLPAPTPIERCRKRAGLLVIQASSPLSSRIENMKKTWVLFYLDYQDHRLATQFIFKQLEHNSNLSQYLLESVTPSIFTALKILSISASALVSAPQFLFRPGEVLPRDRADGLSITIKYLGTTTITPYTSFD